MEFGFVSLNIMENQPLSFKKQKKKGWTLFQCLKVMDLTLAAVS